MFGVGSDPGKAVLEALNKLSKFAPPGSQSQAGQKNATEQMLMKQQQQNAQMQQMKAMQAQGAGGGGQQMPGAGGAQMPPKAA
jgi:hypothetical protein